MLPRRTFRRRIAPLVALVLSVGFCAKNVRAQAARQPYSKEAIIGLLRGEVSPQRVAVLARQRGIDFEITSEVESDLRRAGATDSLLATLRELAPTPPKPPEKPAEIVVQTSPGAEVYVDDQFAGRASLQGRLVVRNPSPGDHTLRVSLAGKRDYEQPVKVTVGETSSVQAALADVEKPKLAGGTVRENPKDRLKYAWIPPGTFMMGCSPGDNECLPEEKPAHQVTITKGFWMGQTEVTVGAYKRFAAATGRQMPPEPNVSGRLLNPGWGGDAMPIVDVTWDDANAYCSWAGGRLPTEAEWEYAARAGSTAARYGDLDEIAWYADNSGREPLDSATIANEEGAIHEKRLNENGNGMHEIGQKRANGFGLYDMLGNVWEWVNDRYDQNYYQNSPSQDPTGPASGQFRVLRGGSWGVLPRGVRVSYRNRGNPAVRHGIYLGFRCGEEVVGP
jgi:formylglycine-generating enzyme required for sulfatase activity